MEVFIGKNGDAYIINTDDYVGRIYNAVSKTNHVDVFIIDIFNDAVKLLKAVGELKYEFSKSVLDICVVKVLNARGLDDAALTYLFPSLPASASELLKLPIEKVKDIIFDSEG